MPDLFRLRDPFPRRRRRLAERHLAVDEVAKVRVWGFLDGVCAKVTEYLVSLGFTNELAASSGPTLVLSSPGLP